MAEFLLGVIAGSVMVGFSVWLTDRANRRRRFARIERELERAMLAHQEKSCGTVLYPIWPERQKELN